MIQKILHDIKILADHFKAYRGSFAIMVILSTIASFFESIGLFLLLPLLSILTNQNQPGNFLYELIKDVFRAIHLDISIASLVLLMIVFFSIKSVFIYIAETYNIKFSNRYLVDLIDKLFSQYKQIEWRYYAEQKRGYLIDYILTVASRNMNLLINLGKAVSGFIMIAVYIASCLLISLELTLVTIGVFLLFLIVYF